MQHSSDNERNETRGFGLFFISKPFGRGTSWQDINAFGNSQSTPSKLDWFLIDFFRDYRKSPHVMVLGNSHGVKSTTYASEKT